MFIRIGSIRLSISSIEDCINEVIDTLEKMRIESGNEGLIVNWKEVIKVSRVDACFDFTWSEGEYFEMDHFKTRLRRNVKVISPGDNLEYLDREFIDNDSDAFVITSSRQSYARSYIFGSRRTGRQVRIYNKTEEIKGTPKEFMKDVWQQTNHWNDDSAVWRFEIELNGNKLKEMVGSKRLSVLSHEMCNTILRMATELVELKTMKYSYNNLCKAPLSESWSIFQNYFLNDYKAKKESVNRAYIESLKKRGKEKCTGLLEKCSY